MCQIKHLQKWDVAKGLAMLFCSRNCENATILPHFLDICGLNICQQSVGFSKWSMGVRRRRKGGLVLNPLTDNC